jgi:hypothetical protein
MWHFLQFAPIGPVNEIHTGLGLNSGSTFGAVPIGLIPIKGRRIS